MLLKALSCELFSACCVKSYVIRTSLDEHIFELALLRFGTYTCPSLNRIWRYVSFFVPFNLCVNCITVISLQLGGYLRQWTFGQTRTFLCLWLSPRIGLRLSRYQRHKACNIIFGFIQILSDSITFRDITMENTSHMPFFMSLTALELHIR